MIREYSNDTPASDQAERTYLLQRARRAFLKRVLKYGTATVDDARESVELPPGVSPIRCVSERDLSVAVIGEGRQQFSRMQIALLLLLYHGQFLCWEHTLRRGRYDADPTRSIHHQLYGRYATEARPLTASQRASLSRMIRGLQKQGLVVEHRRSVIGLSGAGVELAEWLLQHRDTLAQSGITPEGLLTEPEEISAETPVNVGALAHGQRTLTPPETGRRWNER